MIGAKLPLSYQTDNGLKFLDCLTEYLPREYSLENPGQMFSRALILDFKEGIGQASVVNRVSETIRKRIRSKKKIKDTLFICLPASTEERYTLRYKSFSRNISELSGCRDGFDCVSIKDEITPKHCSSFSKKRFRNHFEIQRNINGKNVVIFDDVITSGKTAQVFMEELRKKGAVIIGAIFLGITIKPNNYVNRNNRVQAG